jgi:hypothetical protein
MNNPDYISESLETIFLVKILKFFDADLGSGKDKIWTRDQGWKKLGSGIKIPELQHCRKHQRIDFSLIHTDVFP